MLNHYPIAHVFELTSYVPKVSHVVNKITRVFKKKRVIAHRNLDYLSILFYYTRTLDIRLK